MAVSGSHDRRTYVRLLFALITGGHSGVLRVRLGPRNRWLYFLQGRPVLYRSDLPGDQFDHAAIDAGLLNQIRIDELRELCATDGRTLEEVAVTEGDVTWDELAEFSANRLRLGLGSPLSLSSGEWNFEPRPQLKLDRVDPALLPAVKALEAVWRGVRHNVDLDEVLPTMTDTSGGRWQPGPDLKRRFEAMEVEAPLDRLIEVVGEGATVDELFGAIQDTSGHLIRLLWLMEAVGLLRREGRPCSDDLGRRLSRAATRSAQGKKRKRKKKSRGGEGAPQIIARDHETRMGRDFYGFLGIDVDSEGAVVDRACKLLVQRWRPLEGEKLASTDREHLGQLLRGVQLVWQTLMDPLKRAEYDDRLILGQAPVLDGIHVAVEHPDGV
jgi:hypothetical protein